MLRDERLQHRPVSLLKLEQKAQGRRIRFLGSARRSGGIGRGPRRRFSPVRHARASIALGDGLEALAGPVLELHALGSGRRPRVPATRRAHGSVGVYRAPGHAARDDDSGDRRRRLGGPGAAGAQRGGLARSDSGRMSPDGETPGSCEVRWRPVRRVQRLSPIQILSYVQREKYRPGRPGRAPHSIICVSVTVCMTRIV